MKLENKHTFCHWEHDPISVAKMGQIKPEYTTLGIKFSKQAFFRVNNSGIDNNFQLPFRMTTKCMKSDTCADPESFVRGGPTLMIFLKLVDERTQIPL